MTKSEKTRQWIIEKSAPIFNTKGVAGTAMSDIMAATKLAKGSLYVHFDNKDDLSYCSVDYILSRFQGTITGLTASQSTAKGKLNMVIDALANPGTSAVSGGCPLLNFGMEADDTNPIIREKINKGINGLIKYISQIVETGIQSGEFSSKWNAKEFATKTFAMIEGGILITRVSGNNRQMSVLVNLIKNEIEAMTL